MSHRVEVVLVRFVCRRGHQHLSEAKADKCDAKPKGAALIEARHARLVEAETARRARCAAALSMRRRGASFGEIGEALGNVSRTTAVALVRRGERQEAAAPNSVLSLSARSRNALLNEGVKSKEACLRLIALRGPDYLLATRNIGPVACREILEWCGFNEGED